MDTYLETKTVKTFQCQQELKTVLCQRSAPCDPDDINYKGLCYHLYQNQSELDWNRARQYCRGRHDSDMAYLHITDNDLLLLLLNTTKTDIWIGLSSRTWIWVNGELIKDKVRYHFPFESQKRNVQNETRVMFPSLENVGIIIA